MSSVKVMPDMANQAKEAGKSHTNPKAKQPHKVQPGQNTFAQQLRALMNAKIMKPDAMALIPTEISAPTSHTKEAQKGVLKEAAKNTVDQKQQSAKEQDKPKQKEAVQAKPINTEHAIAAAVIASQTTEIEQVAKQTKPIKEMVQLQQEVTNTEKYALKEATKEGLVFANDSGSVNIKLHKKPLNTPQNHNFSNVAGKGHEVSHQVHQTMLQHQSNRSNVNTAQGTTETAAKFIPEAQQNIRVRPTRAETVKPASNGTTPQPLHNTQAITAQAVQAATRGTESSDKGGKPQNFSNILNGKKADAAGEKVAKFETQRGATALDRARAAKEVADSFKKMLADKTTKMTIHLKPDSLGEVKIKLEIVDKNVTKVTMEALKEVTEVLKNEEQNLTQIIEDAGLSMQNKMQFNDRENPKQFLQEMAGTEQSPEITETVVAAGAATHKHHDGNVNVEV